MVNETLKEILAEIKSLNTNLNQQNDNVFFYLPIIFSFFAIIISLIVLFYEYRKHRANIKFYYALSHGGPKKNDCNDFINIIIINLSYRPSAIINIKLRDKKNLLPSTTRIFSYILKDTEIILPFPINSWETIKLQLTFPDYQTHDVVLVDMDNKAYVIDAYPNLKNVQKINAKNINGNFYVKLCRRLYRYKERILKVLENKNKSDSIED